MVHSYYIEYNRKKILLLLLLIVAIVISGCSHKKDETFYQQIRELVKSNYITVNDEIYEGVEEVYNKNRERIMDFAMKPGNVSKIQNKAVDELTFNKVYLPKPDVNYIDEFRNKGNLKTIISDEYYVESLVYDDKGNSVSAFRVNIGNDEYTLSQGLFIPGRWYETVNDPDRLTMLIADKLKEEEIYEIVILNVRAYNMYLVFMDCESGEYGIPFTSREDFLFLINGKLYEIGEIVNSWINYTGQK